MAGFPSVSVEHVPKRGTLEKRHPNAVSTRPVSATREAGRLSQILFPDRNVSAKGSPKRSLAQERCFAEPKEVCPQQVLEVSSTQEATQEDTWDGKKQNGYVSKSGPQPQKYGYFGFAFRFPRQGTHRGFLGSWG